MKWRIETLGTIVSILIGIVLYALSLWVVSKLGLGLKVSGFGPALVAAVVVITCKGDKND